MFHLAMFQLKMFQFIWHYQYLVDIWKLWQLDKLTTMIVVFGDMYQHHESRKNIVYIFYILP